MKRKQGKRHTPEKIIRKLLEALIGALRQATVYAGGDPFLKCLL